MNINQVDLFWYRLPLAVSFRVRGQVLDQRKGFILRLRSGELTGWGEAAPLPGFSQEDMDHVHEYLMDWRAGLLSTDWGNANDWSATFDRLFQGGLPSGRFALESALLDLFAQRQSVSIRRLLNPDAGDVCSLNALMALQEEDHAVEIARIRSAGYPVVKVKVGRGDPAAEALAIVRLSSELGRAIQLRLDANRAWTLPDAVVFANGLKDAPVEYVEEPLQRPTDIPLFTAQTGCPVGLDETLVDTPRTVWETFDGVKALILKPTLLGGLSRSLRLAQLARQRGWGITISSSFETGVGTRVLCEMAAAFSGPGSPAGLDPYRLLGDDLIRPRLPLAPRCDLSAFVPTAVRDECLQPVR